MKYFIFSCLIFSAFTNLSICYFPRLLFHISHYNFCDQIYSYAIFYVSSLLGHFNNRRIFVKINVSFEYACVWYVSIILMYIFWFLWHDTGLFIYTCTCTVNRTQWKAPFQVVNDVCFQIISTKYNRNI